MQPSKFGTCRKMASGQKCLSSMKRRFTCILVQLLGLLIGLFGTANFLPILTGTHWREGITSITFLVIGWAIGGRMVLRPERFLKWDKTK